MSSSRYRRTRYACTYLAKTINLSLSLSNLRRNSRPLIQVQAWRKSPPHFTSHHMFSCRTLHFERAFPLTRKVATPDRTPFVTLISAGANSSFHSKNVTSSLIPGLYETTYTLPTKKSTPEGALQTLVQNGSGV